MDSSQEAFAEAPAAYLHFTDDRISQEPQRTLSIRYHNFFKIGRDPQSNNFSIDADSDNLVSRNHCELYAVMYNPSVVFVYVRDRKSFNGTYVNNQLIGQGPHMTSGHLLQDGNVILIRPHWKFAFRQNRNSLPYVLTSLQLEECKLFADNYRLSSRCLGHGAEAVVYLATDNLTNKQLVCKVVNLDKVDGRNAVEERRRKFQEADILRQLQHVCKDVLIIEASRTNSSKPNILPFVDSISSPHSLYIFTELASGGDLMSFTYRYYPVAELDARIIIRQVTRALRYLHGKGVVHRDLKPENILLAYSPKVACHRVMLSDFGTCAVPRRNRMMTNIGTAAYQAPEFLSMPQSYTSAVDLWSLGIVSLTLLTCPSSFQLGALGGLDQKSLRKALKEEVFNESPKLSTDGRRFIWACLQVCPSKRITASGADSHDWLCTPAKHLDFFQRLDHRMLGNWHLEKQIRPMPRELPDVEPSRLKIADGPNRMLYTLNANYQLPHPAGEVSELESDASSYFPKPCNSEDEALANTKRQSVVQIKRAAPPKMKLENLPSTNELSRQPVDQDLLTSRNNSRVLAPVHLTQRREKRKRSSVVKIHDAVLLPLTGLGRHLQTSPTMENRENILKKLQETNSKFISEAANTSVTNSSTSKIPTQTSEKRKDIKNNCPPWAIDAATRIRTT